MALNIFGHKVPDSDSIVAAIAMAYLKNTANSGPGSGAGIALENDDGSAMILQKSFEPIFLG